MARTFDFNAVLQQTLETKLNDPEGTVLHVTTPPEGLIEQLAASQDEMSSLWAANGSNVEKVRAAYKLAASIISCNIEGITITPEELRDKYRVPPVALAAYVGVYMEFINDFHNAKN